jgi:oleandomycin transport system ATP-binding protein
MTPAIQATGLVKRYGKTVAVNGVDLAVPAGTVLGLLGPNGSGKTTTVRILSTLITPDAGTATIGGYDIAKRPNAVRSMLGLTGQYAAVDEDLTGRENLELIGALLDMPHKARRARADELLEWMDLVEPAGRVVRTYSGGMRRRLDLAASLFGKPRVLFLDEPTTGLDPRSRLGLWNMVRELVAQGTTVLLTTQYLEEADQLADRITVLEQGRVIAEGSAEELKSRVGGQVLDIGVSHGELEAIVQVLADMAGGNPLVDEETRVITVPAPTSAVLLEAARRLETIGITEPDLALRSPSLDDVFLQLTGHTAESNTAENQSSGNKGGGNKAVEKNDAGTPATESVK